MYTEWKLKIRIVSKQCRTQHLVLGSWLHICLSENIKQTGCPTCCAMDWKRKGKKSRPRYTAFWHSRKQHLNAVIQLKEQFRFTQVVTASKHEHNPISHWISSVSQHSQMWAEKNRERGETFCSMSVSKFTKRRHNYSVNAKQSKELCWYWWLYSWAQRSFLIVSTQSGCKEESQTI